MNKMKPPPNSSPANIKKIREDYRHIEDSNHLYKQIALDHSNNGECWWVYQHIRNSFQGKT